MHILQHSWYVCRLRVLGLFLRAPAMSDLLISNHSHLSIQIYPIPLQPSNTIASLCLVDYPRVFDPLPRLFRSSVCWSRIRISILLAAFHARSVVSVLQSFILVLIMSRVDLAGARS